MKYQITGEPMPVVICQLENGESIVTEGGSMSWMTPNMEMQTSGGGSLGKAFGRMLSGEAIFQNIYTAKGAGEIAFASSFPGAIRAMPISPFWHPSAEWSFRFSSRKRWAQASSAAKASSCRGCRAAALPLSKSTGRRSNTPSEPEKKWWWTPDT